MKIVLDMRKSAQDNAAYYFEKSKKLKGKLKGMTKAIQDTERKLETASAAEPAQPAMKKMRQRRWYEKFRWFTSSDGLMVLGGRDATTNEILIKKHMQPNDIVFHAQIHGAPFFIVKNESASDIPQKTMDEAATAAASYSRAWGKGMGSADVYWVKPQQVSKTPPAGEYLPKGSFMVYGQKSWVKGVELKAAVGVVGEDVIGGPPHAVASKTKDYVVVGVGDTPQGALAKRIRERLGGDLEEIQRFLPAGGGRLIK